MKKLILLVCLLGLSGCVSQSWKEMSDTEKQAWIISGAVVVGAALLADGMSSDTVVVKQCFPQRSLETDCIGR